nr:Peptide chain release factor RF-1 [uncultured bacterium]
MTIQKKLDQIIERYLDLQKQLEQEVCDPKKFAGLSKEYAGLENIYQTILNYKSLLQQKADAEIMLTDPGMRQLAEEELGALKLATEETWQMLRVLLLPKDVDDERSAILEIRAGTGGDEAGLFAADLMRMYQRYAAIHGWQFDVLGLSETGLGSVKEAQVGIVGKGVFAKLKFESGVHRVQRVPETESSGRVHTSAATVAVLPEVEDVDIEIKDEDLRIDICRASGAGGQHVNTTDSAVRLTHLPTGLVVAQQDERSQHKNKAKAMKIMRARLYDLRKREQDEVRAADRKSQVGSGDRSERIRTYNFPQGRVTDHRINLTLYKLDQVMQGEALDELIDNLIADDQARKLGAAED